MKNKSKILIVDDHPVVRQGLKQLIDMEADLMVAGEAPDALQALDLVKKLEPNLVIVDISLKIGSGLELIKNIKVLFPDILILVISMHDESFYAERVIRAGALGYIMKSEASQNVMTAIRKVLAGEIYLSGEMGKKILDKLLRGQAKTAQSPLESLSDREMQVFQMLAEGNRTSDIAQKLNVSLSTIDTHFVHIKKKLGIKDTAKLVQYAMNWFFTEGRNNGNSLYK
jgi:DNA-binding NarL/FixJ family response regulator